ncbi:MAG TPA: hypothetical protein VLA37_00840 [Sphingomonadaceae bacterium]|nr:hypothetical protein [Sphingomonadaceae bacterium]
MTKGRLVRATGLPDGPLDAAAAFHERILPDIRGDLDGVEHIVVVFDAADHAHEDWRLAAIRGLARDAAPCRVNGVVGLLDASQAMAESIRFLDDSPGITGQLFALDGIGAGNPAN